LSNNAEMIKLSCRYCRGGAEKISLFINFLDNRGVAKASDEFYCNFTASFLVPLNTFSKHSSPSLHCNEQNFRNIERNRQERFGGFTTRLVTIYFYGEFR
jgi:hypothetical protein